MKTYISLRTGFIWGGCIAIVIAIVLVLIFGTHPMTWSTLTSDYQAGVDGVRQLFR